MTLETIEAAERGNAEDQFGYCDLEIGFELTPETNDSEPDEPDTSTPLRSVTAQLASGTEANPLDMITVPLDTPVPPTLLDSDSEPPTSPLPLTPPAIDASPPPLDVFLPPTTCTRPAAPTLVSPLCTHIINHAGITAAARAARHQLRAAQVARATSR
jgi:hypothetical protein